MNQTYVFEITFCCHTSALLGYCQMVIAQNRVSGQRIDVDSPMALMTGPQQTMSLVTPTMSFIDAQKANSFKEKLCAYLRNSVKQPLTLKKWLHQFWDSKLLSFMAKEYGQLNEQQNAEPWQFELKYPTMEDIRQAACAVNVDGARHILAAQYLCRQRDYNTKQLCESTLLLPNIEAYLQNSEVKTTTSMTAYDYSRYMIVEKYPYMQQRLFAIIDNSNSHDKSLESMSWSQLAKTLNTWSWQHIILMALELILFRLGRKLDINHLARDRLKQIISLLQQQYDIDAQRKTQIAKHATKITFDLNMSDMSTNPSLKHDELAVSYITVTKIIVGALDALSRANDSQFNDVVEIVCALHDSQLVQNAEQSIWQQEPPHLTELTGVWFKGWLHDVVALHPEAAKALGDPLAIMSADDWYSILRLHWYILDLICRGYHYRVPLTYQQWSKQNLQTLSQKLAQISQDTATMLKAASEFDVNQSDLVWEGRAETLCKVCQITKSESTSEKGFVVEHYDDYPPKSSTNG